MKLSDAELKLKRIIETPESGLVKSRYFEQGIEGIRELQCYRLPEHQSWGILVFDEYGHRIAYRQGIKYKLNYLMAETGTGTFLAVENRWGQGAYYQVNRESNEKTVIIDNLTPGRGKTPILPRTQARRELIKTIA